MRRSWRDLHGRQLSPERELSGIRGESGNIYCKNYWVTLAASIRPIRRHVALNFRRATWRFAPQYRRILLSLLVDVIK
jgi:hypothetical protein